MKQKKESKKIQFFVDFEIILFYFFFLAEIKATIPLKYRRIILATRYLNIYMCVYSYYCRESNHMRIPTFYARSMTLNPERNPTDLFSSARLHYQHNNSLSKPLNKTLLTYNIPRTNKPKYYSFTPHSLQKPTREFVCYCTNNASVKHHLKF